VVTAAVMLLAAIGCLSAGMANASVAALYSAGVSGYSTVLVFYPARGGRPWLGATLYAVSGWLGSGLGLALGAQLGHIPSWLPLAAGALLAALLPWRRDATRRE